MLPASPHHVGILSMPEALQGPTWQALEQPAAPGWQLMVSTPAQVISQVMR